MSLQPENAAFSLFLDRLASCLRYEDPLDKVLPRLVEVLREQSPVNALVLLRRSTQRRAGAPLVWSCTPDLPVEKLAQELSGEQLFVGLCLLLEQAALTRENVADLLPTSLMPHLNAIVLPFSHEGSTQAFALFNKNPLSGHWSVEEERILHVFSNLLAVFSSGRAHCDHQMFRHNVLNTVMNQVKSFVYITDPQTDAILYMNQAMKDTFGITDAEGKICWQLLQHGKTQRCEFCPVERLLQHSDENIVYRWEEHNTRTARYFENYDSLMRWPDGTLVHLQQSIDITDTRQLLGEKHIDELTGLTARRAGLEILAQSVSNAKADDITLTVALLDTNGLKDINDIHGHHAGDQALFLIAEDIAKHFTAPDFCFRLSGDDFVLVLHNENRHGATKALRASLERLEAKKVELGLPFGLSFCYGAFEVRPRMGLSVSAILAKADESMYEQKKQRHIMKAAGKLGGAQVAAIQEKLICDSALLHDALSRSTDSYVYASNIKTGIFHYSPAMVEDFGLPGPVVHNAAAVWGEHVHPEDKQAFLESNQTVADGKSNTHCLEYRAKDKHGRWVWVRCRGHLQRDEQGEPLLFAGFITNLDQKNQIDHVTGLMNKIKFVEDLNDILQSQPDMPLHLMILGIDNFKHTNELHGRAFGDEVLRIIGQKLLAMLPQDMALYRLDGDIFAIVRSGPERNVREFYDSVAESFRYQQEYDGKKYFCPLSGGYSCYPVDASTLEELFQAASCAMNSAKKSGRNRITVFNERLRKDQKRGLELTELLREHIDQNFKGFELFYQPQFTADGKTLVGAEALARWNCEKYGSVSPVEFIPLLEQSGLIVTFGQWVFKEAMRQCKCWTSMQPDFTISVNLSYLQVISDDMLPFIKASLEKTGLSPANVVVEFTESCMIRENAMLQDIFKSIRDLGIGIAMDDFGTGYSSLSMLKTSPADMVKIDRVFVRDILNSRFDATFIRFVVALCHDVNIKVCLEGVERIEELQLVQPMELDYIQGYLFGKPSAADVFEKTFLCKGAPICTN